MPTSSRNTITQPLKLLNFPHSPAIRPHMAPHISNLLLIARHHYSLPPKKNAFNRSLAFSFSMQGLSTQHLSLLLMILLLNKAISLSKQIRLSVNYLTILYFYVFRLIVSPNENLTVFWFARIANGNLNSS